MPDSRLISYFNDAYRAIYSSVWGWWDWYFRSITQQEQPLKTITYENCFRCHTSLPPRDQRRKFNMNYCDFCYDIELQEVLSQILTGFKSINYNYSGSVIKLENKFRNRREQGLFEGNENKFES